MAISVWKILGGAAAGVATVVALPIAGPIGAITALGALAAGAAGAAAGGVASALDDSEERAEKRGEVRADAKNSVQVEKISQSMKEMERQLKSVQDFHNVILAMTSVAMACANCDGSIDDIEEIEIMEFIAGVGKDSLPDDLKARLNALSKNPPSLVEAFKLVKALPITSYDVFDDIIDITINADGLVHPNESKFLEDWNSLKKLV